MKLTDRLLRSIKSRSGQVVFRSEVARLGSPAQVTAALNELMAKGVIARIGRGVYAKTRQSSVTGAVVPAGSLETLATEALQKMGVAVGAGQAAAAYNAGQTTQLPGTFVAHTGNRRISRKIVVGGRTVTYENNFQRTAASN
jgi:predicted transcriptional regulator of viral defense system